MIEINGSEGEGGGQIVRTSLALSMLTGKSFRIEKVRGGRSRPGLLRQHLTALRAAAAVCDAEISGDELGSPEFSFSPNAVRSGNYEFDVGSAGSCTLVLQTVLPPLMLAVGDSSVRLRGGTHNPFAPPIPFLQHAFLPLIELSGPAIELDLERPGFYPSGGGQFTALIKPVETLRPIHVLDRGRLKGQTATAIISKLPAKIATRELDYVQRKLGWPRKSLFVEEVRNSPGPGNAVVLRLEFENVTEVIAAFGEKNLSAERVAQQGVRAAQSYLAADAPVGEHLADQLLLPLALAGGGSFRSIGFSEHARTNLVTIERFLNVRIEAKQEEDSSFLVKVQEHEDA